MKHVLLPPMQRRVLGSVGECMYCGARDGLTVEHLIPFSLGGRDELHDASCGDCARTTSEVEGRIARSPAWWPLRRALELRSRRKKKQPGAFRVRDMSSKPPREIHLPVTDYPLVVPFFRFGQPGLLTQVQPSEQLTGRVDLWTPRPLTNSTPLEISMDLSAEDYARVIAKIALGYAVAEHPLRSMSEIYVRSAILGRSCEDLGSFVGCRDSIAKFKDGKMHGALVEEVGGFVTVSIQLFRAVSALPQLPTYQVIVGKLDPPPVQVREARSYGGLSP